MWTRQPEDVDECGTGCPDGPVPPSRSQKHQSPTLLAIDEILAYEFSEPQSAPCGVYVISPGIVACPIPQLQPRAAAIRRSAGPCPCKSLLPLRRRGPDKVVVEMNAEKLVLALVGPRRLDPALRRVTNELTSKVQRRRVAIEFCPSRREFACLLPDLAVTLPS